MDKKELLAPVGNMESLYQAVHNGADAVYLGLKTFGARAFAKNFSEEDFIKAIKYCHLYGVKIYVTMNTLIKTDEVEAFISTIDFLHKNSVDAVIMQDFGMICLVREMFPNLEIHASTQANNSNLETIKLFYKLGVKRVVLSRELSINEINKIDVPIELECFIHGALCISYSGNCLMSSMIGKRSGNRGECTGCCRLPYSLYENNKLLVSNKYLLSTRELNTSGHIKELLNSKIKSFKIEGRMKSPEYVGFITNFYRHLIDSKEFNYEEETNKLKTLFNRKFTDGNLFETTTLMNIDTPNHIGLKIGKVISVNNKKIKIKLEGVLNQEDGIRFLESGKGFICNYLYNDKDKLINSSDDIVYLDNKIGLTTCDTVYKTQDKKLIESLEKYEEKHLPLRFKLTARKNKVLTLEATSLESKVLVTGNIVEEAISNPISAERIKLQLERLGNSPFYLEKLDLDIDDDIFIPVKNLNEIRREAVSKIISIKENTDNPNYVKKCVKFEKLNLDFEDSILTSSVYTEEQLLTCLELNFKRIYVKDFALYQKYLDNKNVFYVLPRSNFSNSYNINNSLVSEYIDFKKNINLVGNYFLNITNPYTAYYLLRQGLNNFTLSPELDEDETLKLVTSFRKIFKFAFLPEVLVYGKIENMYIKGNILNIDNSLYKYKLKDSKNRYFDVYLDNNNNTTILNYKNIEKYIPNKCQFRFDFYDEDGKTIKEIVKKYQ